MPPRKVVDRRMGLAEVQRRAADLLVKLRERARAIDPRLAHVHDDVGIGAQHLQPARGRLFQHLAVILGRLVRLVEGAGRDDPLGILEGDALNAARAGIVGPGEEAKVLLGPDMPDAATHLARPHRVLRGIARGHDVVPSVARHAEPRDLFGHEPLRPRRVRHQRHAPPLPAERLQGRDRRRIGHAPVMDAAPQVAEEDVVVARDFGQRVDDVRHGTTFVIRAGRNILGAGERPENGPVDRFQRGRGRKAQGNGKPRAFGAAVQACRTGMICFLRLTTPGRITLSPVTVTPKDRSATRRT